MKSVQRPDDPMTEDAKLLRQYFEDGSQEAFTELVSRHVNLVYFTALRIVGGNAHLADDVTQRVFNDLARKASSLKDRAVLAGWLYTGARYAASQAVRAERRRRTHEQEGQEMNELNSTPDGGWERLGPIIDDTMGELNERDREVVLLRYFQNRPLAEIGTKYSISPDAARMRIDRALEKLRGLLARRGIASTSAALAAAFVSQSAMAAPSGLVAKVALGAFSQAGAATAATFGLTKILAGALIGSLGIGFTIYEVKQINRSYATSIVQGGASDVAEPPVPAPAPPPAALGAAQAGTDAAADAGAAVQKTTDDFGWPQVSPFAGDPNPRQTHTIAQFRAKMAQDPEFRAVVIGQAKENLDVYYAHLFRSLGLQAPQLDRLKDLLVEKERLGIEVLEVKKSLGISSDPNLELYREGMDRGQQDVDADIKTLLGDSKYAQYTEYRMDLVQWTAVNAITRRLQGTSTPLTEDQAGKLVVLLRESLLRIKSPFTFDLGYGAGLFCSNIGSALTQRIYDRAGEFLSAPQVNVLRQLQRHSVQSD
jgi:RNA polymerase sigma factor (sigma-70 family)